MDAHSVAFSGCQNGSSGDGYRAVCIQRLIVCGVRCPHGNAAAGNGQVSVGIKAVSIAGRGRDFAACDVNLKVPIWLIRVGCIDAVIGRLKIDISGENVDNRSLQSFIAGGDGD